MITNHPETELLLEYSAGSLPLAPSIAVTTHLQFCSSCNATAEALKDIGGDLLESHDSVEVSASLLDRVLDKVGEPENRTIYREVGCKDKISRLLPRYVRSLLPDSLRWRNLSSSLKVAPISVGETNHELALHKISAGGRAPDHGHNGQEITVVLKGSFSDDGGVYQTGDFLIKEPGDSHRPIAAQNEDCICLSVLAAPIKLKGLKRVFNPFLSFSPS